DSPFSFLSFVLPPADASRESLVEDLAYEFPVGPAAYPFHDAAHKGLLGRLASSLDQVMGPREDRVHDRLKVLAVHSFPPAGVDARECDRAVPASLGLAARRSPDTSAPSPEGAGCTPSCHRVAVPASLGERLRSLPRPEGPSHRSPPGPFPLLLRRERTRPPPRFEERCGPQSPRMR